MWRSFPGLVHLEALEMLSKQCDMKIQSRLLATSGLSSTALQDKYQEIKDLCQLPDDDEEEGGDKWLQKLAAAEEELGVPIATGKLEAVRNILFIELKPRMVSNVGAKVIQN